MKRDQRPTIEEQLAGMKPTIRKNNLDTKLAPKQGKCPPHSQLRSGERCPVCHHHKI